MHAKIDMPGIDYSTFVKGLGIKIIIWVASHNYQCSANSHVEVITEIQAGQGGEAQLML